MKKEVLKDEIKEDGSYHRVEKREWDESDGFVDSAEMAPAGTHDTIRPYRRGKASTISYSTDDPSVTRPVKNAFSLFFIVLGAICLLIPHWFLRLFGAMSLAIGVFLYFRGEKDIQRIEEEHKQQTEKSK